MRSASTATGEPERAREPALSAFKLVVPLGTAFRRAALAAHRQHLVVVLEGDLIARETWKFDVEHIPVVELSEVDRRGPIPAGVCPKRLSRRSCMVSRSWTGSQGICPS